MKRIAAAAAAAGFALVLSAGSALADAPELTNPELLRKAACLNIDQSTNVVATYNPGDTPAPGDDTCTVVSTSTSLASSISQVNNANAKKAVNRIVETETTVTTTQEYRWVVGQNPGWDASGTPVTEEEAAIISQCIENPSGIHCE
jgi:hypothetical protein